MILLKREDCGLEESKMDMSLIRKLVQEFRQDNDGSLDQVVVVDMGKEDGFKIYSGFMRLDIVLA